MIYFLVTKTDRELQDWKITFFYSVVFISFTCQSLGETKSFAEFSNHRNRKLTC